MCSKQTLPVPPVLLVVSVVCLLGMFLSREAFVVEALPVFSYEPKGSVYVELAGEGIAPGVRQYSDGSAFTSVMDLTGSSNLESFQPDLFWKQPLISGEHLTVVKIDRQINVFRKGWMPASQRMALGIPLHPNRMKVDDWEALPGIGPTLAERIERNRQKYGEFDSLLSLSRVKGIGKKRLRSWEDFFIGP